MTASLDTPLPGDLPGTGGPPAADGVAAPPLLSDVDRRIAVAFGDLARARTRFADSPSGDGVTACLDAESAVNELLELRLTLTREAAQPAC
jgi:hypothetical protein